MISIRNYSSTLALLWQAKKIVFEDISQHLLRKSNLSGDSFLSFILKDEIKDWFMIW
jgi:hypothetical protein